MFELKLKMEYIGISKEKTFEGLIQRVCIIQLDFSMEKEEFLQIGSGSIIMGFTFSTLTIEPF